MSLWTNISNRFKREQPKVETTAAPAAPMVSQGAQTTDLYEKFKVDNDRLSVIKYARKMYDTDSRVKKSLRTYARDLVRSGFLVKTDNKQALAIALEMIARLNLNRKLQDAVRLSGRDGDSFYEVVVDENYIITKLSRKPTLRMRRNSDGRDEFQDPSKAFYMMPIDQFYDAQIPKDAIWFAEWQMIHARFDHDEESRYGTPMWKSSMTAYKRASEGETDMAVRRKVRASMRIHHVVEGTAADIEAYKEVNKAALSNPTAAQMDLFSNKAGGINAVQGDAHLNEINDVLHQINTMFFASETPMELMGYGGDLNRDVLGEKKAEYDESLDDGRDWLAEDFVRPLLERQWLLQGIMPEGVKYKIVWRKAKGLTPTMIRDLADACMRLKILGMKEDLIQLIIAQYLPDVDLDILTGDGFDSERFADMLKGLSI